jgi:hypothetical protein
MSVSETTSEPEDTMSAYTATAQPLGYITARADDLREVVRQYRANEASLRRLTYSRPVRNYNATARAEANRTHDREVAELSLAAFGSDRAKFVIGGLIDERKLLVRLDTARRLGQERPELHDRLRAVRAHIRRQLSV